MTTIFYATMDLREFHVELGVRQSRNGIFCAFIHRLRIQKCQWDTSSGHFYNALPQIICTGWITEQFDLDKEQVRDDDCAKNKNDFCPRKQLEELLIYSCGQPKLQFNRTDESGSVHAVNDANDTLNKMLANVDEFVIKYGWIGFTCKER